MNIIKENFQLGKYEVSLETGHIARQASASVKVTMGDTVVLVTAVAKKEARESADFFPLTINYIEKAYAAGKIPGGFLRREGRPSDHETLIARLIDRPLRPLFPAGFFNEIQVVATVVSFDKEVPADIPALIGASAALSLTGVPFAGPVGAVRVGFKDGKYLLNPSYEELKNSELDLVVAGTTDAVLMVESEAKCLPEDTMLGAVLFGHEQMKVIAEAIADLAKNAEVEKWNWEAPVKNKALTDMVKKSHNSLIIEAFAETDKQKRTSLLSSLRKSAVESVIADETDDTEYSESDILKVVQYLEKTHVRSNILNGKPRIDGRNTRTVRPIESLISVLPRAHGSSLFTRGETQALVVATLGNDKDAKLVETLSGVTKDRFILHYNFPPYSVGETGMIGSPKRREIGHGALARRALNYVLPTPEDYPYVIRLVSEITESNGSSSMASVCGGSLAMMDAGIPLKAPVAGIAMGLIKDGNKFAVLTDILGDEDHLGDMDFKVAGTKDGITALQMDIKITGITRDIMTAALSQAKDARLHILDIMNEAISVSKSEVSKHAPQVSTIKVKPNFVRAIIGKGGATIKHICEQSEASLDLTDDGTIKIFANGEESLKKALDMIAEITAEIEVGKVYLQSKVAKVVDFGAFINVLPNQDVLCHISDLPDNVKSGHDFFKEGQLVDIKIVSCEEDRRKKGKMNYKMELLK